MSKITPGKIVRVIAAPSLKEVISIQITLLWLNGFNNRKGLTELDLKLGSMYDAIHKTDPDKSLIIKVIECGKVYVQVEVTEINGFVERSEFMETRKWNFYEIRSKEYQKNIDDLLEIQKLAVELGCKDLFDKCKRELMPT
jgi:hypothetical protein